MIGDSGVAERELNAIYMMILRMTMMMNDDDHFLPIKGGIHNGIFI